MPEPRERRQAADAVMQRKLLPQHLNDGRSRPREGYRCGLRLAIRPEPFVPRPVDSPKRSAFARPSRRMHRGRRAGSAM